MLPKRRGKISKFFTKHYMIYILVSQSYIYCGSKRNMKRIRTGVLSPHRVLVHYPNTPLNHWWISIYNGGV